MIDFFKTHSKVAIIDDQKNEAKGLLNILNKTPLNIKYSNGNISRIDETLEIFMGVRLVILDMNLKFTTSDHDTSRNLVSVLKKIISPQNGPYILAIWSKEEDSLREDFEEKLNEEKGNSPHIEPIKIVSFEKSQFFMTEIPGVIQEKTKEDIYTDIVTLLQSEGLDSEIPDLKNGLEQIIETIQFQEEIVNSIVFLEGKEEVLKDKVNEKIQEEKEFLELILWEEIVKKSNKDVIKNIFEEKSVSEVLYNLAKAKAGNTLGNKKRDRIKNSFSVLQNLLSENVEEKLINLDMFVEDVTEETSNDLSNFLKSNYNTKLLTQNWNREKIAPGNIYKINLENALEDELNTLLGGLSEKLYINKYDGDFSSLSSSQQRKAKSKIRKNIRKEINGVEIEVSPVCDFSQDKQRYLRYLEGCLIPIEVCKAIDFKNCPTIFVSPTLIFNEEEVKLVLSTKLFKTTKVERTKENYLFGVRKELLTIIQQNAGSHITRQGMTSF